MLLLGPLHLFFQEAPSNGFNEEETSNKLPKECFLDCPFPFQGIDNETILFEARENSVENMHVMVKIIAETSNVVNIFFQHQMCVCFVNCEVAVRIERTYKSFKLKRIVK